MSDEHRRLLREVRRTVTVYNALTFFAGAVLVVVAVRLSTGSVLAKGLEVIGTTLASAALVSFIFGAITIRDTTLQVGQAVSSAMEDTLRPLRESLHAEALMLYRWDCYVDGALPDDPRPEYGHQFVRICYRIPTVPRELRAVCFASFSDDVLESFGDDRYIFRWLVDEGLDPEDAAIFQIAHLRIDGRTLALPQARPLDVLGKPGVEYRFAIPPGTANDRQPCHRPGGCRPQVHRKRPQGTHPDPALPAGNRRGIPDHGGFPVERAQADRSGGRDQPPRPRPSGQLRFDSPRPTRPCRGPCVLPVHAAARQRGSLHDRSTYGHAEHMSGSAKPSPTEPETCRGSPHRGRTCSGDPWHVSHLVSCTLEATGSDSMSAVHYDSYTQARAHLKDLLDAAEQGCTATVRRESSTAAVVDAERLRHFLAAVRPVRAQAVAEAGGWSVFIPGLPIAAEGVTFDEAVLDMVDALREYAADWQERLKDAPNHWEHWGLVQLINLSSDEQLQSWLVGILGDLAATGLRGPRTALQVRDIPEDVVAMLKTRAKARGQSLTAYLRDLLTQEAARPSIEDVMANIATREPINYTIEDLRSFIHDGHQ